MVIFESSKWFYLMRRYFAGVIILIIPITNIIGLTFIYKNKYNINLVESLVDIFTNKFLIFFLLSTCSIFSLVSYFLTDKETKKVVLKTKHMEITEYNLFVHKIKYSEINNMYRTKDGFDNIILELKDGDRLKITQTINGYEEMYKQLKDKVVPFIEVQFLENTE